MIFLPILALAVGVLIGLLVVGPVRGDAGTYIGIACLAGLDTICGGIRSILERKFHTDIFVTGFISNIIIASFISWLGDRIGINLFLAAALVLAWRIFVNLSLIRRYALTKWLESRDRKRAKEQGQTAQQVNPT